MWLLLCIAAFVVVEFQVTYAANDMAAANAACGIFNRSEPLVNNNVIQTCRSGFPCPVGSTCFWNQALTMGYCCVPRTVICPGGAAPHADRNPMSRNPLPRPCSPQTAQRFCPAGFTNCALTNVNAHFCCPN